jgi:hypothetical protein
MCILRSEVFREVQEAIYGDSDLEDDDVTSDDECEECEECVKASVSLMGRLNHVLGKCGEEPMVKEEWLGLPTGNKMRVCVYAYNLRKQQLAEADGMEGEGKVPCLDEVEEEFNLVATQFLLNIQ